MGKNTADKIILAYSSVKENELGLDKGESIEQPVKLFLAISTDQKVSKIFAGNSKIIIASKQFAKNQKM